MAREQSRRAPERANHGVPERISYNAQLCCLGDRTRKTVITRPIPGTAFRTRRFSPRRLCASAWRFG